MEQSIEIIQAYYKGVRFHEYRQTQEISLASSYFKKVKELVYVAFEELKNDDNPDNFILLSDISHDLVSNISTLIRYQNFYDDYKIYEHSNLILINIDQFISFIHNIIDGKINEFAYNLYCGTMHLGTKKNPVRMSKRIIIIKNNKKEILRVYTDTEIEYIRQGFVEQKENINIKIMSRYTVFVTGLINYNNDKRKNSSR